MLFNSPSFGVFLAVVLALYYGPLRGARSRKLLLVVSSYAFYASWNPPFALLLLFSTLLDYAIGRRLEHAAGAGRRRGLLGLSLAGNLGVLGFFKYGDFIADNWLWLWAGIPPGTQAPVMDLIVPVGISFYTFQTLSYSFDIYRGKQPASRSFLDFACYVSFFPQLVAGPIVRSAILLPQLRALPAATSRDIEYGLMRFGTGLAKKVVFADALAAYVDPVFASPASFAGLNLWVAMYAYAYQIYFDFSGYTDMAIGLARLFGLRVPENFDRPYLAASPREFWQRWHITLSTWLRDYVYIGFGGNRLGSMRGYANLLVTMLLGGLWHGAAWTFVLWGAVHGLWLALHRLVASQRPARTPRVVRQFATFQLVCFGWVLFRASSLADAGAFFSGMASVDFAISPEAGAAFALLLAAAAIHVAAPPDGWRHAFVVAPAWAQGLGYAAIAVAVFLLAPGTQPFIYFQF